MPLVIPNPDPFTYFTVTGEADFIANVKFSPSIWETQASTAETSVVLRPVLGHYVNGVLKGMNGKAGVKLVANTDELGMLPTPLTYRVDFTKVHYAVIAADGQKGVRRAWTSYSATESSMRPFIFIAPTDDSVIDLDAVPRLDPDTVLDNWIDPEAS